MPSKIDSLSLRRPRSSFPEAGVPSGGWLRGQRIALGLTQADVAQRLKMKRQSYAELERAEMRRAISLASLQKAAAAMSCDFVYFILPRNSRSTAVVPPLPTAPGEVDVKARPFPDEERKDRDGRMSAGLGGGKGVHGAERRLVP